MNGDDGQKMTKYAKHKFLADPTQRDSEISNKTDSGGCSLRMAICLGVKNNRIQLERL